MAYAIARATGPVLDDRDDVTFRHELRAGWRNLAAATIGLSVGIGAYVPVSSLFMRALEQQFGWSRATTAGAMVAMPITAVVLPFAGALIDRIGVRLATALSAIAATACYVMLSHLDGRVAPYYGAIVALNLLGCATGPIAYTRLLTTQFRAGRGSALACSQFGIAAMGIVLPPVVSAIMADAGWRGAYLLLAVLGAVGGLAAQMLMRPVGTRGRLGTGDGAGTSGTLLGNRAFWILGIAVFAVSSAALGVVSQLQSILVERGIASRDAPYLLSLLAISVATSRLLVGTLLDRGDPRRVSATVMLVAACGATILASTTGGLASSIVGVVLIGVSLGAELDLLAFFCVQLFGTGRYARNYGLLSIFFYVGIFVGSAGFGTLRDRSSGYASSLVVAAVLLAAAALLFRLLPHGGDRR